MEKRRGRKAYARRRKKRIIMLSFNLLVISIILLAIVAFKTVKTKANIDGRRPDIDVQLLTVNKYSRPGIESDKITGVVVHYTANPGSTAKENRDYFESLKDGHDTSVSSHFVIGLDGEIIQCVPTWELAYASNERNHDTVSIECCHPDDTGKFKWKTYNSLVSLTSYLCLKYDLTEEDVIRHYDVTGKMCPKYYVENEDKWVEFKKDVKNAMKNTDLSALEWKELLPGKNKLVIIKVETKDRKCEVR